MSELRKANTTSPYFITCTIVGWINIFTNAKYCDLIINCLRYCQINKGMKIYSYVIMPNHLHMIAHNENEKLPAILRDFKSYSAKQILRTIHKEKRKAYRKTLLSMFEHAAVFSSQNTKFQIWQKTNYPIELNYEFIFNQKQRYIELNPIKAGITNDSNSYVYSSCNPDSPLEIDQY